MYEYIHCHKRAIIFTIEQQIYEFKIAQLTKLKVSRSYGL